MLTGIVITTIHQNTAVDIYDKIITELELQDAFQLYVIGDVETPKLTVTNGHYYSIDEQEYRFKANPFYDTLPYNCYTRKNLGYLLAFNDGCDAIFSTDDDNFPLGVQGLLNQCDFSQTTDLWLSPGLGTYANPLSYFANNGQYTLWPRGIPPSEHYYCHIQQMAISQPSFGVISSVCNDCPDLDAIGHVLYPNPICFSHQKPLYHQNGYVPYNTQSTTIQRNWLIYHFLPSLTGRACDIWASYLGQQVMHAFGAGTLLISPTLTQRRNAHKTEQDIRDEKEVIVKVNIMVKEILSDITIRDNEHGHDYYYRLCSAVSPIMPKSFMTQIDLWLQSISS